MIKQIVLTLLVLLAAVATGAVAQTTYKVSVKEGTEDASNWQGKAGEGEYQSLPLEGVAAGTAVSFKYSGTKHVKSVKAVKKASAEPEPVEPTLANTMTNAGMTVKVKYNDDGKENYCQFTSNGDGTYTFQSGGGDIGGDDGCAKALVVEGGKLVFKQNYYETITKYWDTDGYSFTFDTSNSTYSVWVAASRQGNSHSFISVEVNGTTISLSNAAITVDDLVKEEMQSWEDIVSNNSDKIYSDCDIIKRLSDGAKLLQSDDGESWREVSPWDNYETYYTYKFAGD